MGNETMIRLENIKKRFQTKAGELEVLHGVSADIKKGEVFGIIGLSGAGKSTLVRCINLLERPTGGKVYLDGVELTALNEKELRAMGQIVSGYLDFAERQAEREQPMTMQDWAAHLDRVLTMSGEQLLLDVGSISHEQAMKKATEEYKKYKARTLSSVEQDYLLCMKDLQNKSKELK